MYMVSARARLREPVTGLCGHSFIFTGFQSRQLHLYTFISLCSHFYKHLLDLLIHDFNRHSLIISFQCNPLNRPISVFHLVLYLKNVIIRLLLLALQFNILAMTETRFVLTLLKIQLFNKS